MTVFPAHARRTFGVGLDLPWGAAIGFVEDPVRGERVADRVGQFLARHADVFGAMFVSWQPRERSRPRVAAYGRAWDDVWRRAPAGAARALHHTMLNLGAIERYPRGALLEFTDALCARYGLGWVNEDLGLWSLHGRPLPYPLPPYLTTGGLAAAVANVREVMAGMTTPLVLEFPGFSDGTSVVVGRMDAYDFFRHVAEETDVAVTLDVGHLLSWRWLTGARGEALYDGLERLPLAACFELHLSGCAISAGKFCDFHHGVLMDEQLELLGRLLPLCPNARVVTYEDPKFDEQGQLVRKSVAGFERLRALVGRWAAVAA